MKKKIYAQYTEMTTEILNAVVDEIEFGILSKEDILNMSVAEINNTKLYGSNSVYDEKMGPTVITKDNCITCGLSAKFCTGHFGHIKLSHPIFHPLYEKEILKLLKIFCFSCSRLIQSEDGKPPGETSGAGNSSGGRSAGRVKKIEKSIDKRSICPWCNLKQPIWELEDNDSVSVIYMTMECTKVECSSYDVLHMFSKFQRDDLTRIHFYSNPMNLIIEVLPVLPPSTRPVVRLEEKFCDDDLTIQYIEIIKINNIIANKKEAKNFEIDKNIKVLYFRISSLFNNSSGKSKHNTNGKAIKGLKERLETKNGLMRENLMGKRVEKSARTVIGPEPTLCMNELAIPVEFAKTLTIAERVTEHNLQTLTKIVHSGLAKFIHRRNLQAEINLQYALKKKGTRLAHGDIIIRNGKEISYDPKMNLYGSDYIIRNNELIEVISDHPKNIKLEIGDIVDRCLKDGDYVILNRQPTLHFGSMIAQRIRIIPTKTLRFSLCITKSFNADFDGDEGNLHVPQNPSAIVELQNLSSVQNHILSQKNGDANTVLVQDNLLSLYLMTSETSHRMDKEDFFDLCLQLVDENNQTWDIDRIMRKIEHIGIDIRFETKSISSQHVISLCFPDTLMFKLDEDCLIEYGVWKKGFFKKSIMTKLIKTVFHVYGQATTMMMINNLQFISNNWLSHRGFSIGLDDCITNTERSLIPETIMRCFTEANSLQSQIYHEGIKEVRVQGALNKARDVGMRIAKEGLSLKNNFLSTVHSGSKGDFFNIAQIAGLLGQQNFRGRRIEKLLNHGQRALYHYPWTLKEDKDIYESRGFIRHSFLRGLNPREQYFHAVSGREGITDTALGTGETGYMQRRIIKLMEDIHIANDGTLRDDNKKIYQFYYGKLGYDTTGVPTVKDLVNEINASQCVGFKTQPL